MWFLILGLPLSYCVLGLLFHTSYLENTSIFGEQLSLNFSWLLLFLIPCCIFHYSEHVVFAKTLSEMYLPQIILIRMNFHHFMLNTIKKCKIKSSTLKLFKNPLPYKLCFCKTITLLPQGSAISKWILE